MNVNVYLFIYLSIYLSMCQSPCQSNYLSNYLSIYVSIWLSISFISLNFLHHFSSLPTPLRAVSRSDSSGAVRYFKSYVHQSEPNKSHETFCPPLFVHLSMSLYVYLLIYLSICLSNCLSLYLSIYLSIY